MIKYFNRNSKTYEIEKVAGEKYLNWTYTSPIGKSLLELLIKKKAFSKLYGFYCDTSFSSKSITKFINDFNIDMNRYSKKHNDFKSFNDFFARELEQSHLKINSDKDILISPGDGKLLAYENISIDKLVQVKGFSYSLKELVKNDVISEKYKNGTCLILRLCPTDYHRFHFVDNGTCSETHKIKGSYYSVNPVALKTIKKVFCENKREFSILNSENFDDILYMEVGATGVGAIIQSYSPNEKILKGSEKGYFKFGGSTVILFFKENVIKIDSDIIAQTNLGFETSVTMGEKIGIKI